MYYEEKINYIINEFRELFLKMLKEKNCIFNDDSFLFSALIKKVKQYFPEQKELFERVLYYYYEVEDSEEKLELLMILYKNIKEAIYG